MICIIGAIKEEISGIKQHITIKKKYKIGSATFYQGLHKSKEIIIVRSGVGQSPAHRATSDAVKTFPLRCIISIGFAGGVIPELKVSDLILSDKIFYCDNEESLFQFINIPLSQVKVSCNQGDRINKILTENGIKYKSGNIISINRVADSIKLKEWLGRNYPVCGVEMETASIAKIAAEQGVPFFSLRAISDEVSHAIVQSDKFINKKGEINRLAAGYFVLTHPSLIPKIIELKKSASEAAKVLTKAVLKIISSNDIC